MFILSIICLIISALLTLGATLNQKSGLRLVSLAFHVPILVFFILYVFK